MKTLNNPHHPKWNKISAGFLFKLEKRAAAIALARWLNPTVRK